MLWVYLTFIQKLQLPGQPLPLQDQSEGLEGPWAELKCDPRPQGEEGKGTVRPENTLRDETFTVSFF